MRILNAGLMIDNTTPNGFQDAIRNVSTLYRDINCGDKNFNQNLLAIAEEMRPDIIFLQIQTPGILNLGVAKRLAELSFVIQWNGDIRDITPEWGLELGQIIQLTTYSNMRDVRYTRSLGIQSDFLQIGIDPKRYNKHSYPPSVPDIVFMGNNYETIYPLSQERKQLVDHMKANFGNNFGVYGKGWYGANGDLMADQVSESKHYNGAKIAINQNHFNEERFTSDRLFRALGSGVMVLSHEFEGMEEDFEIGKHLDTYKDFDDLVDKCNYYLQNVDKRNEIAQEGYKLCQENFTFAAMANNIVKLYERYYQVQS